MLNIYILRASPRSIRHSKEFYRIDSEHLKNEILSFHGVSKLAKTKEMEDMGKAIEEIGAAKTCITGQIVQETKKILKEKGLDAAELYAAQLTGTDENTELMRVLKILRKYKLSPEVSAKVLDSLGIIESGKW